MASECEHRVLEIEHELDETGPVSASGGDVNFQVVVNAFYRCATCGERVEGTPPDCENEAYICDLDDCDE